MRRKIVRKERLFYRLKKNEAAYIFINFRTRLYLCGNGQTKGGRCGREPEKAPAGRKISSCPELPFYSAFRTTGGKLNEFVVQRTEKLTAVAAAFAAYSSAGDAYVPPQSQKRQREHENNKQTERCRAVYFPVSRKCHSVLNSRRCSRILPHCFWKRAAHGRF